jgi:hypothetical protein
VASGVLATSMTRRRPWQHTHSSTSFANTCRMKGAHACCDGLCGLVGSSKVPRVCAAKTSQRKRPVNKPGKPGKPGPAILDPRRAVGCLFAERSETNARIQSPSGERYKALLISSRRDHVDHDRGSVGNMGRLRFCRGKAGLRWPIGMCFVRVSPAAIPSRASSTTEGCLARMPD